MLYNFLDRVVLLTLLGPPARHPPQFTKPSMLLRDPVSSASHLLAAVWAAYATVVLIRACPPGAGLRAAAAVYGGTMVVLFLASGAFHAVPFTADFHPSALWVFRTADRSAIFLLIAGTNTVVMTALLVGQWRAWGLAAIWAVAAAGIAALWAFPAPPFALTVGLYVSMGWLGMAPLAKYVRAVGWRGMSWAAAGGVAYTLGAACDLGGWPVLTAGTYAVGPHEVFHLAIIVGAVAFYAFARRHVLPYATHRPMFGRHASSY